MEALHDRPSDPIRVPIRRPALGGALHHTITGRSDPDWGTRCCLCNHSATTGQVICKVYPQGFINPTVICAFCIRTLTDTLPPDTSEKAMAKIVDKSSLVSWINRGKTSMEST